jgi:hypothetical protein
VAEDRDRQAAYAVDLKGGGLMALDGLWDTWLSPAGERNPQRTIITAQLNAVARRRGGGAAAAEAAADPTPSRTHDPLAGRCASW